MTQKRYQRMRQVLMRRQKSLTVLLENVHKPHNTSAILRTCDAVGVYEAHAIKIQATARSHRRASASATTYVQVHQHIDVGVAIETLHRQGMAVWAAHQSPKAVDFRSLDYTAPVALLFGQELDGVTDIAAAAVDGHIVVPMMGMVASLNVSVACAVVLFEAQRQRQAAGMYDTSPGSPLSDDRLFEWLYPRVAAALRAQGQAYPPLDDEGEMAPG